MVEAAVVISRQEIMDEHAPLKTMKVRAKETPFMNGELRRAVRVKTRLHNIYRKRPTKHNWERYRQQRNVTTNIRKNAIRDYFLTTSVVVAPEMVISGKQ